jgi:hypothetical protein
VIAARNYTAIAHTGDVTADTIYTTTLPAIGVSGVIKLKFGFKQTSQTPVASQVVVRLNGVQISADGFWDDSCGPNMGFEMNLTLYNRMATNSQVNVQEGKVTGTCAIFGSHLLNVGVTSIDTSSPTTLTVTAQNGTNSDTQTFNYFIAEVMQ